MGELLGVTKTGDLRIRYTDSVVPESTHFRHFHDTYELNLFIRADIHVFVQNTDYRVAGGDMLFVNEFDIHSYTYCRMPHYTRYVLNFKREFIAPLLETLHVDTLLDEMGRMPVKMIHLNVKQLIEMESLCGRILEASHQADISGSPLARAKTMALLQVIILRFYELMRERNRLEKKQEAPTLSQKVLRYIDGNFAQEIRLDTLEKIFFANKFYISHVFKCDTGFSVIEYLQYRRIAEAQKRIKSTDHSLIDICLECGFNNVQNFYRVFKKVAGITPRQYLESLSQK